VSSEATGTEAAERELTESELEKVRGGVNVDADARRAASYSNVGSSATPGSVSASYQGPDPRS